MKILLLISLLVLSLFGEKFQKPVAEFVANGVVTDIIIDKEKLYAATDASCVDVFDLKSRKRIETIKIDKIKDFMGDIIDAKIYSVDLIGKKLLMLSEGMQGYRRVYINEDGINSLLIDESLSLSIAKAKFLDKNTILLALLSDEIISYDISAKKLNYRVDASASKFSDFVLSEDKKRVVVADESGEIQLLNTKDGSHIKVFSGQNLDNVFKVDYKNNIIATAGQDRRVVIYDENLKSVYYKVSSFFIYCVGLSPTGRLAAYSSDVENNITLFDTKTRAVISKFGGNKITLSKILFLSENEFLASSDYNIINLYKIK